MTHLVVMDGRWVLLCCICESRFINPKLNVLCFEYLARIYVVVFSVGVESTYI